MIITDKTIIAIDFDGTLCKNAFPKIGDPYNAVIEFVLTCGAAGAKLILWTCRTGKYLEDAIRWCAKRGLTFDAVNENYSYDRSYGPEGRKIFAHYYIDDHAINPMGSGVGKRLEMPFTIDILNKYQADVVQISKYGDAYPTGLYYAGKRHKIVCAGDCYHVRNIKKENRITYTTYTEAMYDGCKPCKHCHANFSFMKDTKNTQLLTEWDD